jgi:hypothetical protein
MDFRVAFYTLNWNLYITEVLNLSFANEQIKVTSALLTKVLNHNT